MESWKINRDILNLQIGIFYARDEESTEHSGRAQKQKFSSHDKEDDDINSDDIDSDDLGSDDDRGVDSEDSDVDDARTRFTNCSMTSSVVPRNENLRMLDEKYFVVIKYESIIIIIIIACDSSLVLMLSF